MTLQVGTQVEKGQWQETLCAEYQCDEQPTDPPVAVQERMDRFKLIVDQGQTNERGERRGLMKVLFQFCERRHHLCGRRRDKLRGFYLATGATYPVLSFPELSGRQ